MMSMRSLAFSAALAAVSFVPLPVPADAAENGKPDPAATNLIHELDNAFAQVFQKVAPAVVVIEADRKGADDSGEPGEFSIFGAPPVDPDSQHFHMPRAPSRSEGSGFIVRPDGYILTNYHVIEDADSISVRLKDGRHFPAKIVGTDDKTDIAVIKIGASSLPIAALGDSEALRVGQLVCAIGVPFNLDFSFTCGWVSAKHRSDLTDTPYEDYIQTDTFINPGSSGGPLFDVDGNVIGMNTLINGIGRGLAFAIPSSLLKTISDQLISTGHIVRPWLGIRIDTLSEKSDLKDQIPELDKGVVVETIFPDTPAYKSDLRATDVITQVDGVDLATSLDLQKEILKKKVGQAVELTVWRNGKFLKIALTTEESRIPGVLAANAVAPKQPKPPAPGGKSDEKAGLYGLQLQDVNQGLADELKLKTASGALVTDVQPGSPSAADVQREDVITAVDSKPVANAQACRDLIQSGDSTKGVLLFIDRKGQKTYAILKSDK